jgi:hypothetical protein
MSKRRFQHMRSLHSIRLLFVLGLVAGFTVTAMGADQQASKPPSHAAGRPVQIPAPKKAVVPTSPKLAKILAARKGKGTVAQNEALAEGKRDPFKVPEIPTGGHGNGQSILDSSAPGGALPPGVRGLLIAQLRLEGVVREQADNKMIAVVTNETRRAYFLTENEAVYNGVVSKITPDAVYFKENVLDANGRLTTHEVMKRLSPGSGEGR